MHPRPRPDDPRRGRIERFADIILADVAAQRRRLGHERDRIHDAASQIARARQIDAKSRQDRFNVGMILCLCHLHCLHPTATPGKLLRLRAQLSLIAQPGCEIRVISE